MLKDYQEPKRHWTNKQWINHCSINMHNPWISNEERLYYREKYMDLFILNFCANNQNKTAAEKNMKHVRFFFLFVLQVLREKLHRIE